MATYLKKALTCLLFLILIINCRADANMRICGFKLTSALKTICRNQVCGGVTSEISQKSKSDYLIYCYGTWEIIWLFVLEYNSGGLRLCPNPPHKSI